jgi:hypothetical protein
MPTRNTVTRRSDELVHIGHLLTWCAAGPRPLTKPRGLGHGASDSTALYELHDVAAYLADDAQKLREFIGITENAPRLKLETGA